MTREFNKTFNSNCCEKDYRNCNWTCGEIQERINSRAPVGSVYTRGQIDTLIHSLRSQLAAALSSNTVLINTEANLPPATYNNAGFLFLTTDNPYKLFISDGITWRLVVDEEAFTLINDFSTVLEKATYDVNDTGFIDVAAGGTGADNSNSSGILTFNNGIGITTNNYLLSQKRQIGSNTQLLPSDASIQIFEIFSDREIYMPATPELSSYFRIINSSITHELIIRDGIGGSALINLSVAGSRAADFHYNDGDWYVVALNLV